jgi:WD40 repeat protein
MSTLLEVLLLVLAFTFVLPRAPAAAPPPLCTDRHGDPLPVGAVARLGTIRFHGPQLTCVAFSRDGKTLVVGGRDGLLHVWDRRTGKEVRCFGDHFGCSVSCLALSPDGKLLATGADKLLVVSLWDFATGKLIRRSNWQSESVDPVCSLAFSPDGKTLASGSFGVSDRNRICIWDVATVKRKRSLLNPVKRPWWNSIPLVFFTPRWYAVYDLAFSRDGKYLAAGDCIEGTCLWDTSTWRRTGPQVQGCPVQYWLADLWDAYLDANPFFNCAAYLALELTGCVCNTSTWQRPHPWKEPPRSTQIAFTPDGKLLAVDSGSLGLWDLATGKEGRRYGPKGPFVGCMALSPNGKVIVASTAIGTIHAWDTTTGKELWRGQESSGFRSLTFSPDGKVVAAMTTFRVGLWETGSGKCLNPTREPSDGVQRLSWSRDGKTLAAAYQGLGVRMWETQKWQEVLKGKAPGLPPTPPYMYDDLGHLWAGPKQKVLALTGGHDAFHLWDVSAGRRMGLLKGHLWPTVIAPDGDSVFACTQDGLVLWQPTTDKVLRRFSEDLHWRSLSLSGDGEILAGAGRTFCLWDVRTATLLTKFGGKLDQGGFVALSPDGRIVLSQVDYRTYPDYTPRENSLCLWEAATGKLRLRLQGQLGNIDSAAISPDGRLLAVTGEWDRARLWDLSTGKPIGTLAGHRGPVTSVAFSPDGQKLASGGLDTTALVWDVRRLVPRESGPAPKLTDRQMEALWKDLAGDDAPRAYRAIWALAGQTGRVEQFLKQKLDRAVALLVRMEELIAELDNDEFASREKASRELEKLGEAARPALCAGLRRKLSLEATRRLEVLVGKLPASAPGPEELRTTRALEVLQRVDSKDARRLLDTLGPARARRK